MQHNSISIIIFTHFLSAMHVYSIEKSGFYVFFNS